MTSASVLLALIATHVAIGLPVGVAFAALGAGRIDPAAGARGRARTRFRLLLIPGAIALWPIVLTRWLRAVRSPGSSVVPPPSRSMRPERRIHLVAWLILTPALITAVAWAWHARERQRAELAPADPATAARPATLANGAAP